MKNQRYRHRAAFLLALLLAVNACLGYVTNISSYAYTARSATVKATSLNVRSGPGTSYSIVAKLTSGAAVTVIDEKKASDGALWYQLRFQSGGTEKTGYALSTYIKFPTAYTASADFEAYLNSQGFPESYKPALRQLHAEYPNWVFIAQHTNLDWKTAVSNEVVLPRSLVSSSSISSWKSTADGAYDWDTSTWPGFDGSGWVAASEAITAYYMDPRNFLDEIYVFQFLLQSYDSSVQTKEGLETMIKGSFLENGYAGTGTGSTGNSGPGGTGSSGNSSGSSGGNLVGPGANLDSNGNVIGGNNNSGNSGGSGGPGTNGNSGTSGNQSNSGEVYLRPPGATASISKNDTNIVATMIGPGMTGDPALTTGPGTDTSTGTAQASLNGSSYVDIIMDAGVQSGVNPYVLAAMIIQEQGAGTSGLISGKYPGYEGYYNYFNVEAYQSGSMNAIQRGLWYASQSGSYGRPWNTVEKSILGGAMIYGDNYVKAGQDTFYLKRFNVQGSNLYKHQYMTNIQGAASEGAIYAKAYNDEMKKTALQFKIPVYLNMPETPAAKPTVDGSPNNKLSGLGVDGFALTPTFNKDTLSYDLIVDTSVTSVTVNATACDSKATISGTGTINLQSGGNDIKISVKAENGDVREYVIHVVKRQNGPTNDGSVNNGVVAGGNNSSGAVGPGGNSGPGGTSGTSSGTGVVGPGAGLSGPGAGENDSSGTNGGTHTGPGGSNVTVVQ